MNRGDPLHENMFNGSHPRQEGVRWAADVPRRNDVREWVAYTDNLVGRVDINAQINEGPTAGRGKPLIAAFHDGTWHVIHRRSSAGDSNKYVYGYGPFDTLEGAQAAYLLEASSVL